MNIHSKRLKKAFKFAYKAHLGQMRKYTGEPYIVHCIEVMQMVKNITNDEDMLIASLLHDTVEDTQVSFKDIMTVFHGRVAWFVNGLSDLTPVSKGNRAYRKQEYINKIKDFSYEVHTIKCADLISNANSIIKYDDKFSKVYINEMKNLLDNLLFADEKLRNHAYLIVNNYLNTMFEKTISEQKDLDLKFEKIFIKNRYNLFA